MGSNSLLYPVNKENVIHYYLDYSVIMSYNYRHNFIVGDRGVGKTYGLTKWLLTKCIKQKKKFIWVRNTDAVLKEMISFEGRGFLADHPQNLGLDSSLFTVVKGTLFYGEQLVGIFTALSGFFKLKGVNFDDFEYFVFDEFMPEVKEAIRIDYDYALKSILQSVFRKRTNFKAFYLANVLKTSSNILDFFKFQISPHFPNQVIQRNPGLSGIIFYLQNKEKNTTNENNPIETLGDAFATANKYTESSLILDYKNNIDKDCNTNMKRKEVIMYATSSSHYFLLREYKAKIAVMMIKQPGNTQQIPLYALNKKHVHGEALYDNKVRNQLLQMWNSGMFIFRNEYTLTQFTQALFAN